MKPLVLAFLLFVPRPIDQSVDLPPLPTSVWSVYGPVPVLRQHPTECGGAIGCYQRLKRRILVEDSLDAVLAWRVFYHEEYHVMAFDQNAGFSSAQDEQVAANVYANHRVAQMMAGKPGP